MSSSFGQAIRVTIFGQSHSEGIGVVVDGLPVGEKVDLDLVWRFMARRAPGKDALSTARKEDDAPFVLSGLYRGMTCGAPLCATIVNRDARSQDYEAMRFTPRPAHADYPAHVKYGGFADPRGGGHFSGRLTAPLCFAGALCLQILARRGVAVGAHILSVGGIEDFPFDPVGVSDDLLRALPEKSFPVLDEKAGRAMQEEIMRAKEDGDSVGGVIELCALGLPAGLGEPMFGGVEGRLSQALFGIPAVKGVDFGAGFAASRMRGSEHNDPFVYDGGVKTRTNRHGGILGGITTGMPLLLRAAFKPTPSIAQEQDTVDLKKNEGVKLIVRGRHDPCILPRAVPVVEAAAGVVLLDLMKQSGR